MLVVSEGFLAHVVHQPCRLLPTQRSTARLRVSCPNAQHRKWLCRHSLPCFIRDGRPVVAMVELLLHEATGSQQSRSPTTCPEPWTCLCATCWCISRARSTKATDSLCLSGTLPENALEHMDVTQDNRATQTNLKTIASKTTCQQFKCEHSLQDVT